MPLLGVRGRGESPAAGPQRVVQDPGLTPAPRRRRGWRRACVSCSPRAIGAHPPPQCGANYKVAPAGAGSGTARRAPRAEQRSLRHQRDPADRDAALPHSPPSLPSRVAASGTQPFRPDCCILQRRPSEFCLSSLWLSGFGDIRPLSLHRSPYFLLVTLCNPRRGRVVPPQVPILWPLLSGVHNNIVLAKDPVVEYPSTLEGNYNLQLRSQRS